ncbi:fimbria/pilus outer membrane usher protein [Enterobacter soli]|uniref:fimbria/pilus outer membrane usher protein n=1 Tax=Enterobacter soli TaxID=885040 RepID=UPI0034CDC3F0
MLPIITKRPFNIRALTLAIWAAVCPVYADDYFNISALETETPLENSGALEAYLRSNGLTPGDYLTAIVWNHDLIDKRNVTYLLSKDGKTLIPQFTKADLRELGAKVDAMPGIKDLEDDALVGDISRYIPEAKFIFSPESHVLQVHIPQIYRNSHISGETSPKNWDDGIPALWASYYFSGSRQQNNSSTSTSNWASVNSGLNVGPWRLKNASNWDQTQGWESISTTLERDLKSLRSQLAIGQTYTNGELFDSVQMTGVKMETDTGMLPSSLQGFAPVVRGIAASDAKVIVKQNGYTIYQTNVSPGPFEIHDLSQVTAGADLEVTVQEANGAEQHFIQASSSVPIMLREDAYKYSLSGGQYRGVNAAEEPEFGQGTLIYGLPYGMTVYGGLQGASMYQAGLIGLGADLRDFGSLSMDLTAAKTTLNDDRDVANGQSWRAQYAKDFPATDTTVTLASYRYSTAGFYTFQEALDQRSNRYDDDDFYNYRGKNNRRSRFQLNLSQSLDVLGSIYANAYQQDYWGLKGHERSISFGYSSSWNNINWSVNYNLTKTPFMDDDQQVSLTINVPLSRWLTNAWATYTVTDVKKSGTSHQAGISGTLLEDNNLSYNLQQTYMGNDEGNGGYLSSRYRASAGEVSASYSYQKDSKQWGYSAQGSIVAHPHGVTLGQAVQNAFGIVHIKDGDNVKVQNTQGVYTDYWGNAVVPSLTSYRRNSITVNTRGRAEIDIHDASASVIPTKGAVVAADFTARSGKRALVTLTRPQGMVPFGAILSMDGVTNIVGEEGEVYLTGLKGTQAFRVQWGETPETQCAGKISVPENAKAGLLHMTASCQ